MCSSSEVMQPRRRGETLEILTPSKVNLFLEVSGKRPDGYHEIDTVVEAVDLCDTLTVGPGPKGIRVETDHPLLPSGPENLVFQAARLFFRHIAEEPAVRIFIHKRVPPGSGLGGGSANAAGTLLALAAFTGKKLSDRALLELARRLGSDVPFFLWGGIARCRGRGDEVKLLGAPSPRRYLLLLPEVSVSTAEVYRSLNFPLTSPRTLGSMSLEAVESLLGSGRLFFNRLQEAAFEKQPFLRRIKERVERCGVRVMVTGSGSCLFGLLSEGMTPSAVREALGAYRDRVTVAIAGNLPPWRRTSDREGGSENHQRSGTAGGGR